MGPQVLINDTWYKSSPPGTVLGRCRRPREYFEATQEDFLGSAVGVACLSDDAHAGGREGGPNPMLTAHLPGWLLA
jgi:hypothetical protein